MALNPVMVIGGIALVGWLASMAAGPPAEADEQPPDEQPPTVDPDFFKDFEPQPIPKVDEKDVITLPAGPPTSQLMSSSIVIGIN